jgi:hypothetical protein
MRIDTNTRGHLQWFNFRVKNMGKKKVKFNIVNFQKAKTLYQRVSPYSYAGNEALRLQLVPQADQRNGLVSGRRQRQILSKETYLLVPRRLVRALANNSLLP